MARHDPKHPSFAKVVDKDGKDDKYSVQAVRYGEVPSEDQAPSVKPDRPVVCCGVGDEDVCSNTSEEHDQAVDNEEEASVVPSGLPVTWHKSSCLIR